LAFDYCGVTAAATIKHQSPTDELLSDVGQNEPKKEIKRKLTAGLDKLGFIEAPFNPGLNPGLTPCAST
jgi:hypothetical protein